MNLHPLTVILLLALAFLFYSQGQVFFFFTTLAIGFLLLVVSLSDSTTLAREESKHASSLYPEKMEIKISGDEKSSGDGQKELGESVGGFVDFTGKLVGWLLPIPRREKKEEKKEDKKEEKK